jgi:hypothetical protein
MLRAFSDGENRKKVLTYKARPDRLTPLHVKYSKKAELKQSKKCSTAQVYAETNI